MMEGVASEAASLAGHLGLILDSHIGYGSPRKQDTAAAFRFRPE
jgi:hypothetical protein